MPLPPRHDAETFYAETHFEQMARRPGAPARDEALAAAQLKIDELKVDFFDWLNRQLKELGSALAILDADPSVTSQTERAYHICAQVRDVGTTMGYSLVTFVAKTLCEVLESIRAGAIYEKEMIDCHINALFYVAKEPHRNLTQEQVAELSGGLRRLAGVASISPGKDHA
jgi:hypothetical protein